MFFARLPRHEASVNFFVSTRRIYFLGAKTLMSLDKKTVASIANLARIKVPNDKLDNLAVQLSSILDWVEQLNSVNTDGVEPLASVVDITLPLREDEVTDGNYRDKVLANGPETEDGYYAVPKVVD